MHKKTPQPKRIFTWAIDENKISTGTSILAFIVPAVCSPKFSESFVINCLTHAWTESECRLVLITAIFRVLLMLFANSLFEASILCAESLTPAYLACRERQHPGLCILHFSFNFSANTWNTTHLQNWPWCWCRIGTLVYLQSTQEKP